MFRLAILVAIAILVILLNRSRRAVQMSRVEAAKGAIGSLEGDRQVIEQLRQAGADLAKPTEVNFYLYFKDRAAAEGAAAHASEGPLVASVSPAAAGAFAWLCFVTGQMVPTEAAIHAQSQRLLALALAHGGEYDGWEAAVVE